MTDDQLSLASAYLAHDVSDAERTRVETDPELLAIVEQLQAVRRAVADTPPPADDARERAIQAALAAWETPPAANVATAPPTESTVVPLRRRPRSARVLGIAAACLALAGVGAVVVTGQRSDDDVASIATDMVGDAPDDTSIASAERIDESAADLLAEADDSMPGDTETATADGVDDALDGDGADVSGGAAPTLAAAPLPEVADPDELAALVRLLLDEPGRVEGDRPDTGPPGTGAPANGEQAITCEGLVARELGAALYDGRPVVVGVDADGERALAVDPVDCSLVADTPLDTGAG